MLGDNGLHWESLDADFTIDVGVDSAGVDGITVAGYEQNLDANSGGGREGDVGGP
ncbi:hypothetical protein [Aurantimonas sp. C2-4-R8]|uniref:hypothetical protein n=1 Tax=Aurantimonas sp. C2-4-R8 TaxID=3114364 RepID=UPI003FA48176